MRLKIILNNWKNNPGKVLLIFSALIIAFIITILLSTLHYSLQKYFLNEGQREKILRELHINPRGGKLELSIFNLIPQPKLSQKILEEIASLPEVKEILPTNTINGISSLQINLLGQIFQTDSLLFGGKWEMLDIPDISKEQWENINEPYPAVVSTKLIDLYNLSFANANNLPQLTEKNFHGAEITILLNESTFFAQGEKEKIKLHAKIVGFSPNTKLLGLTLSEKAINNINSNYLKKNENKYLDAIVRVHSPNQLTSAMEKINAMGLDVKTAEKSLHTLENIFTTSEIALNTFFVLMMTMTGLLISTTFLAKITEKQREIAILKTIGLTGHKVAEIYLLEAFFISMLASGLGTLIAWSLSFPLEQITSKWLENLLSKPEKFFTFTPEIFLKLTIFTVFISCLFSFLPAKKAAELDPIAILSK